MNDTELRLLTESDIKEIFGADLELFGLTKQVSEMIDILRDHAREGSVKAIELLVGIALRAIGALESASPAKLTEVAELSPAWPVLVYPDSPAHIQIVIKLLKDIKVGKKLPSLRYTLKGLEGFKRNVVNILNVGSCAYFIAAKSLFLKHLESASQHLAPSARSAWADVLEKERWELAALKKGYIRCFKRASTDLILKGEFPSESLLDEFVEDAGFSVLTDYSLSKLKKPPPEPDLSQGYADFWDKFNEWAVDTGCPRLDGNYLITSCHNILVKMTNGQYHSERYSLRPAGNTKVIARASKDPDKDRKDGIWEEFKRIASLILEEGNGKRLTLKRPKKRLIRKVRRTSHL